MMDSLGAGQSFSGLCVASMLGDDIDQVIDCSGKQLDFSLLLIESSLYPSITNRSEK